MSSSLSQNLVAFWKFDEASGDATDSVNSNVLVNENSTPYAAGLNGNGVDMESANNHRFTITDAAQTGLDITGSMSASLWFKPESAPGTGESETLFAKITSGSYSYQFIYYNVAGTLKLRLYLYPQSNGTIEIPFLRNQNLGTGAFKHIVWVYTQSTTSVEMYVDGVSIGTVTDSRATGIANSGAPFYVGGGAITGTSNGTDGIIDDLAIWSRALTAAEVSTLYNAGAGSRYPFTNTTTVTVDTSTYSMTTFTVRTFLTKMRNTSRPTSSMTNVSTVSPSITNVTMSNTDSLWAPRTAPWLLTSPWTSPVYGMTNVTKP